MITWGISANSHDGAVAVFDDDEILFASHTERFSGIKNDPHLNHRIKNYAMQWGYPQEIIWYEDPMLKSLRQLRAGQGYRFQENDVERYLQSYNILSPVTKMEHHHSHAAAGYYTSGFDDAIVVVIDSIGEFETYTVWHGTGDNLVKVYSQSYPHSIGLWYSAMTQRIGLKPNEEEYILMGMAAYGDPHRYADEIYSTFIDKDKKFIDKFARSKINKVRMRHNLHRGCSWWMPLERAFDYTDEPTQWAYDVAAGTQFVYEKIFADIIKNVAQDGFSSNLVLMGGCALNCKANTIAPASFDNVWIMPNPGDAGSAIGAVLAHKGKHIKWPGPYLGYDIEREYKHDKIIETLQTEKIVGIANGKAEYGPRAFGNRSLLADPRDPNIKERVNRIKQRQEFRPFAPAILAEYADIYFDGPSGPYMQYTPTCKKPNEYPGIIHADGTSRVQTVTREDNPNFRALLEEWYKVTGCPMLLNTSLNIKGKPMVNDELDATEFQKMYGVKVY